MQNIHKLAKMKHNKKKILEKVHEWRHEHNKVERVFTIDCPECEKPVVTQYNYKLCMPCIRDWEWNLITTLKKKLWMESLQDWDEVLYEEPYGEERIQLDKKRYEQKCRRYKKIMYPARGNKPAYSPIPEKDTVDVEEMLEHAKILRNIPTIVIGGLQGTIKYFFNI